MALRGGGEAGAIVRSFDWASTPLGPIASWSVSLRNVVGMLLHSKHPMFLWWGSELVQVYNDAYLPSFGRGKHPRAMGQPGRECWSEIWPIIGPQIDAVMRSGTASWNEDQLVPISRNGRLEEVYWTYGYSPVFDDDETVGGTLVVCTETTQRVVSERRLRSLRALSDKMALAATVREVTDEAFASLATQRGDVPFALLYTVDRGTGEARLTRTLGLDDAQRAFLGAHFRLPRDKRSTVSGLEGPVPIGQSVRTSDGWEVNDVVIAGLTSNPSSSDDGYLVFGLSARVSFDEPYADYFAQIGQQLALARGRAESFRIRAATEGERNNLLLQAPVPTALLIGPTHVFQLANPLYREMVGKDRELIGKAYVDAFPELVDTPLPGILDAVYRTGTPFVSNELCIPLDRDGDGVAEECFFKFNLEATRDLDGHIYGMMAVATEITDQVVARRTLERGQAEHEGMLVGLEAASQAKDEFLAMLGHELRNPIAPIMTAVQLLKLRGGAAVTREIQVIDRQTQHLVRLVDDLLDVARIARGKVILERRAVEVGDVLAGAIETASPLIENARHRLIVTASSHGLVVDADRSRLSQVFANLLTNAAKYTPPGGTILVAAAREGSEVVVRITDSGVGLSAELLPRVFDLFVQARQTLARDQGGLGLGLAIVKNLVILHGGSVSVDSAGLGSGSVFTVRLPALDSPPERRDAPARTPHAADRLRARVLVVDDNVDAAEMLAEAIEAMGYETAVAHDGAEAIHVAERFRPQVALLDIGLPIMDGYELVGRLRAQPASAPTCIAVTGYGQQTDRERTRAAGFAAHLTKPVDLEALAGLLESVAARDGRTSTTAPNR